MIADHLREFEEHARKALPNEAVAVVVARGEKQVLVPLPNHHPDPKDNFLIRPCDWVRETPLSLIHSHCTGSPEPSIADRAMCEELGIPWHIYSVEQNRWQLLLPCGYRAPLAGREFIWGIHDCFALVRDYYAEKLDIHFENYFRPYEFWVEGKDLITPLLEENNFKPVKEHREHDLVVMQLQSRVPNHLGIMRQNNLILHHINRRVSSVSIYGGVWLQNTVGIYRHMNLW